MDVFILRARMVGEKKKEKIDSMGAIILKKMCWCSVLGFLKYAALIFIKTVWVFFVVCMWPRNGVSSSSVCRWHGGERRLKLRIRAGDGSLSSSPFSWHVTFTTWSLVTQLLGYTCLSCNWQKNTFKAFPLLLSGALSVCMSIQW